ncbi:MAG: GAP family protein [Candidatus Aenigmarchaeota archaeon]|nr:GAP family protein [Candidatus Aenigmarchaeota archaeon]
MVEANLPTLGIVTITALIDSINPCAIGVLILLISTLLASAKMKHQILRIGLIYIAAVYIVYFTAGMGLVYFFSSIPLVIAEYISIAVGAVIIGMGLIELKDFYWYGQGFSLAISPDRAKQIHDYTKKITLPGIIFLGAFVALVELPCTGGPYLAVITVLKESFNFNAVLLLAYYNVIFVLPLIIILLMVYTGTKVQYLKKWKQQNRGYMRLLTGLLLIHLGWLLMLIANGTINLG